MVVEDGMGALVLVLSRLNVTHILGTRHLSNRHDDLRGQGCGLGRPYC